MEAVESFLAEWPTTERSVDTIALDTLLTSRFAAPAKAVPRNREAENMTTRPARLPTPATRLQTE